MAKRNYCILAESWGASLASVPVGLPLNFEYGGAMLMGGTLSASLYT